MAFKELVRDQYFMLLLDEGRSIEAIPAMLARDRKNASQQDATCGGFSITSAYGTISPGAARRDGAVFAENSGEASDVDGLGEVVSASLHGRLSRACQELRNHRHVNNWQ
jgi:hypothetical protein